MGEAWYEAEQLKKLMLSRGFNIFANWCRIASLIIMVWLFLYIWKNVEAIKLLNMDVCKLCMDRTGCSCLCLNP